MVESDHNPIVSIHDPRCRRTFAIVYRKIGGGKPRKNKIWDKLPLGDPYAISKGNYWKTNPKSRMGLVIGKKNVDMPSELQIRERSPNV